MRHIRFYVKWLMVKVTVHCFLVLSFPILGSIPDERNRFVFDINATQEAAMFRPPFQAQMSKVKATW